MPSPFQMNTFQNSVSNVTMPGFQVTDVGPAPPTGGVGAVPHQLSMRRRRELTRLLFAADSARERAVKLKKPSKRDALLNAADAAKEAVALATDVQVATGRLDRVIARNVELLRSATRAANEARLINQVEAAIEASRQIIAERERLEQEEEEEMINLLLLS